MKKVAIVLSGSGVYDGSELHESVLTLLEVERNGAQYQCFAPNIDQAHVINHFTGEVAEGEKRNVLIESARIARGEIKDINQAHADDFDAVIFPGGFGAAKNLCDFAFNGAECNLHEGVLQFAKAMAEAGKPAGYMCIAPAMIPKIYAEGVQCTIGNDKDTAAAIEAMGAKHVECSVSDIVTDTDHKVVTTPAYMLAQRPLEAHAGIEKLVKKVVGWA